MNITRLNIKKEHEPLSKAQKTFNRLNNRINKLKKSIESVPAKLDKMRRFHAEKILPLGQKLSEVKYQTVKQLDYLLSTEKFGKRQRETLLHILVDELGDLDEYIDRDNPRYDELQNMYDRFMKQIHGEDAYVQMKVEQTQQIKGMAEQMFHINLDGIDLESERLEDSDIFRERVEQRIHALEEDGDGSHARSRTTRKTKQSARAEARKQEENASLKTLRELYTDLVKRLHPDREQDETLRLEKTEQMKQITEAYERKDLASLLLMQINWLQRTDKDPVSQPEEVLNRYNNVLKMHIGKLEDEYRQLAWNQLPFDLGGFNMYSVIDSDIRRLDYYLNNTLLEVQGELSRAEDLFARIHTAAGLKQYIKEYWERPVFFISNEDDVLNMFM